MIIGVLALQGSFLEHKQMLEIIGVEVREVRVVKDLEGIAGIILPGGESTAISLLWDKNGLYAALKSKIHSKEISAYGTCAGAILMAKKIVGKKIPHSLEAIDISLQRNGYGGQLGSFIEDISIPKISDKHIKSVFIRAPIITDVFGNAEVLAKNSRNEIVVVQQDNIIVSTFHPELTNDESVHRYFVELCGSTINPFA
jgi:5'-phosphate synthase pdxT subunit